MRVITGTARGRTLATLEGEDVRPTAERVKEAIFSMLQFEIEGRTVLDLFAGSGQLGIEALSRGAQKAVFVDADKNAIKVIKSNIEKTGFTDKSSVFNSDALSYLRFSGEKFHIAFLDPPYSKGLLEKALPEVAKKMHTSGVIVCELPVRDTEPEGAEGFELYRTYKYGKIKIAVYRFAKEMTE